MMIQKALSVLVSVAAMVAFAGCGGAKDEQAPAHLPSGQTSSAAPAGERVFDAATAVTLKGRVLFEGQAPAREELPVRGNPECAVFHEGGSVLSERVLVQDGGLQNVFVYVKEGLSGYKFPPPQAPAIVSNVKCVYAPHVLGVRVGQTVELHNEDATLHNIHSYSKRNKSFNLGLPFQGMKQSKKFTEPEVMITLKCDVHPWMVGYLAVVEHPCFAVSRPGGAFEIKDLPPGNYVIEAWHEEYGTQTQTIEVAAGQSPEISFTFKAA